MLTVRVLAVGTNQSERCPLLAALRLNDVPEIGEAIGQEKQRQTGSALEPMFYDERRLAGRSRRVVDSRPV